MEYLRVGLIVRPHGVRGAIKLLPLSDDTRRFLHLRDAYLERNGRYDAVTLRDVSVQPDSVQAHIDGVETREEAEKLRNVYIVVDREHTAALSDGHYFVADLIGCEVFDDSGEQLGILTDIVDTPANDVYYVNGKQKFSVPAIKKLIKETDVSKKRIVFDKAVLAEVILVED